MNNLLHKVFNITPFIRHPFFYLESSINNTVVINFDFFQNRCTFFQRTHLPLPGWNMLEVDISHDQPSAVFKIFFDYGDGYIEDHPVYLPLKSGRVVKRLFFVPKFVKALRIEPIDSNGIFCFKHFRIVWLPPWFAHDRLAQRLINMHHMYRDSSKSTVLVKLKNTAIEKKIHWRTLALAAYEQTFERRDIRSNYLQWLSRQDCLSKKDAIDQMCQWSQKPLISILVPVFNPDPSYLKKCLDSVLGQFYVLWQLCIADDASTDSAVKKILNEYALNDSRISVVHRQRNGHICAASNSALTLANGEFLALLDHDDCLTPDALFQVVKALQFYPDAGLLYSDEDKLNELEERFEPHFKPNWNPELLLAQNYISHLSVFRTELVREVGGFRVGFEGSQDHDLVLRVCRRLQAKQIVHIPRVLYHWRASAGSTALSSNQKSYSSKAGLAAVQDHFQSIESQAKVYEGHLSNTYRITWPLPSPMPMVSLLVPTRDKLHLLQPCVDAILKLTIYSNFELLILDNQSSCSQTLAYMKQVAERDHRVRVLRWDSLFNYSAINNFGVANAHGSIIGLINNDVEPINADWLEQMVRQVCRTEIGCVGAKLYYPNDTIQHAGVVLGIGGVAGHGHKYFSRNAAGYFSRLQLAHNVSAVTGACLVVRKNVYEELGGLDEENLKVSFNDVDFCLKVREAGYRNLFTPYAELYHHESMSRGPNDTSSKRALANAEAAFMRKKWGNLLDTDPYYNPNLTLVHEDFSLG